VPKFLVNEDGSLGERNDAHCVSIEHKLGIRRSTVSPDFRPFSEGAFSTGAGLKAVAAKALWWHVCNSQPQT
jgi:hypothetical protein